MWKAIADATIPAHIYTAYWLYDFNHSAKHHDGVCFFQGITQRESLPVINLYMQQQSHNAGDSFNIVNGED